MKERLLALDVFRGLTIALMFTVNNPGTWAYIYDPLEHAKWSGWTPTDFVYPFFLFTVGVAAWFSIKSAKSKVQNADQQPATNNNQLKIKIIRRGATIFLIGLGLNLFLNGLSTYSNLRIMGVLQRIGIAYMIAMLLLVSFRQRTVAFIGITILLGYWALMFFCSDAQYPYGFHNGIKYIGVENNVVTKFDRAVLGASHLYKGYDGIAFDPEGLLSTLPAVVTVIIGFFVGGLISRRKDRKELAAEMLFYGLLCLALGELWNLGFPINKPIWSSSYVIFMAGWAMCLNALLILIIDVYGIKFWVKPVLVLGMNSMLAFIVSGVFVKVISKLKFDSSYEVYTNKIDGSSTPKRIGGYQKLYEDYFSPITTPHQLLVEVKANRITVNNRAETFNDFVAKQKLSSFIFALFHVLLFWSILYIFYKRGFFLKI